MKFQMKLCRSTAENCFLRSSSRPRRHWRWFTPESLHVKNGWRYWKILLGTLIQSDHCSTNYNSNFGWTIHDFLIKTFHAMYMYFILVTKTGRLLVMYGLFLAAVPNIEFGNKYVILLCKHKLFSYLLHKMIIMVHMHVVITSK